MEMVRSGEAPSSGPFGATFPLRGGRRAAQVCRPYELRESSGLAVGADDPGGPRAHTVRPYRRNELPL